MSKWQVFSDLDNLESRLSHAFGALNTSPYI